jgi:hypothetical protein
VPAQRRAPEPPRVVDQKQDELERVRHAPRVSSSSVAVGGCRLLALVS